MIRQFRLVPPALLVTVMVLAGCGKSNNDNVKVEPQPALPVVAVKADGVDGERAKLSPGDRTLVEAQEWCVISTDERLGSMGPPVKLDIKGQPVFVCCNGCKKKAEADPDKTLAMLAELKTKKAGGNPATPDKKADPKDDKHDHGKTDPKGGHNHGAGGMGMGGMGMMGDPKAMQDMMGIRGLFAARDKITRKVNNLKDGVETITESEDAKVAEQIRQHVATMYKRIEEGKAIMPMSHQPIFGELIKHAKSIRFKSEKTEKGIKVTETSDDPYVAKLLQSHAELVTAFIRNGMEQMMKEHPLPLRDEKK